MQKTFEILLDVEKELYTPSNLLFNVSRNDFESVELLFTITQDQKALDLTDKIVELAIKKPSGLVVYQTVEITDAPDGNAATMLSIQAYVEFGVHGAEIIVRNESQIMVTCPFYFYSREAIMDAAEVESVNDWSVLQQALFSMDKRPILVDGIPTTVPEYVGQMAFDIGVNKRAFIANDLTETGWQLLGAGEGGGGIVDWDSILGKPIAFPPEIHTHDFVDIQGKPDVYPPEAHNHEILSINGLQAALDAKADDADLTGIQTALTGKADDADLIPFITESEADVKYALKGEIGGGGGAWGEITGTLSAQTDLQTALNAKADDTDLTGKANLADLAAKANSADVYLKTATYSKTEVDTALTGKANASALTTKADSADVYLKTETFTKAEVNTALTGKADASALTAKANSADVYLKTETYNKTEVDTALTAKADAVALAGKVDDADLVPYITEAEADIKYEIKGQGATGATWGEITGTLSAQTDLQAALDEKADDADLATKANTADVYPKTATYDKTEVDAIVTGITEGGGTIVQDNLTSNSISAALSANQGRILNETKADVADLAAKADAVDLTAKANSADVYPKTTTYNKTEVDTALSTKANSADLTAKADASALTAKANSADVYLKTETYSKTEVDTALTGKASTAHTHTIANVTGLQAAIDGKANTADLAAKADAVHTHTIANVTGLQTALDGKADDGDLTAKANSVDVYAKTATYSKTEVDTALTGKANSSDLAAKADAVHTHTIANVTGLQAAIDGKASTAHTHTIANVTGLQAAIDGKANSADLATKANSADVYAKTETYNKTEIDTALTGKADDADLVPFITEAEADIKYEPIGGGGGAWGGITGTLSAQTDLQTALDGKADDADLATKADVNHNHTFASLQSLPTTFTPPLMSGAVVGGAQLGNGLAMSGNYLFVRTGTAASTGMKIDPSINVAIDRAVVDTWYPSATQMNGLTLWQGTQTSYDALTKDPNTLYFITGA